MTGELKKPEVSVEGRRVYVQTHKVPAYVEAVKSVAAKWDRETSRWWVGAAKKESLLAALAAAEGKVAADPDAQEDPHKVRLTGKVTYKGRSYFAGSSTRDGARVRLVTLPDASGKYLDFWADAAQVTWVKRYSPRSEGYGRYAREVHQTLGGIADFIRRQKDPARRAEKRAECSECGEWGPAGTVCQECHEGSHVG